MGNGSSSVISLKSEFQRSSVRKWQIEQLEDALETYNGLVEPGTMMMNLDVFVQAFSKLNMRDAVKHFKPFSERESVRSMVKSNSRKGSSLTIFTGMCILTSASEKEKLRFLFNLFDLNKTSSLCVDECLVALTCVLRALGTLGETIPKLLKAKPEFLDSLVQEPFRRAGSYLYWSEFCPWAEIFIVEYLSEGCGSPVPLRDGYPSELRKTMKRNPSTHLDDETMREKIVVVDEYSEESKSSNNNQGSDTEEGDNDMHYFHPDLDENTFLKSEGPRVSCEEGEMFVEVSPRSAAVTIESTVSEERGEDEEDEFLDSSQAIDQILNCLPEIDNGDLSSLPWVLEALRLLAEHDGCETLGLIVCKVLPLVCNVAACEDPSLARDAFQVLTVMIDGAPDRLSESCDTVNERALLEMILVRSTDQDILVATAANACLMKIAEKQPYGFGRTLAALLEAGTLHELAPVVQQCSVAVEYVINHMPEKHIIGADLDGRIGLLLSALCLWAHGELPEVKHCAKIIMIKLGIRYGGDPEWEDAVKNTDSFLLDAWNRGVDPSPEEEAEMERKHQQGRKLEEMMGKFADEAGDPRELDAASRGWIVPAGRRRIPCPASACMYPQVFAILGFRGRGGPTMGVPRQSAFDVSGSFRKREILTEKRTVEFTKILWNGKVQVWEEVEETVKETTHLEAETGLFAHRETIRTRQEEIVGGKSQNKEKSKRDFVHFKNETGEFSTYIDCNSPKSPQLESPTGVVGIGSKIRDISELSPSAFQDELKLDGFQSYDDDCERSDYIVEEPFSPK